MRTAPKHPHGSALLTVIILCAVLSILAGSILSYSLSEKRLNHRDALRLEARYAAEAAAEYAVSQVRQKFSERSIISLDIKGSDAVQPPPIAFWNGGHVDPSSIEVLCGTLTTITTNNTSSLYYLNPTDAANKNDPDIGKWVQRRDVPLLAKATVRPPNGAPPSPLTSWSDFPSGLFRYFAMRFSITWIWRFLLEPK